MSSIPSISWRDLLQGGAQTDFGDSIPNLHTKVKITNATMPSISKYIEENVTIPLSPQPFPAGFFDNFDNLIEETELDESAMRWLMSAVMVRIHEGEATVETTFKRHFLQAVLEIIRRKLPHLSEEIGREIALRFTEQQTVNVDVGVDKKDLEGFKPDGQIDIEKPDGSRQTVVVLEAKAEKKVARAVAQIRKVLAGRRGEKFDPRCKALLKQIGAYCIILNTRWVAIYDDDVLVLVRFDDLKYTDGKPDFDAGLGDTFSIEIVEDKSQ